MFLLSILVCDTVEPLEPTNPQTPFFTHINPNRKIKQSGSQLLLRDPIKMQQLGLQSLVTT